MQLVTQQCDGNLKAEHFDGTGRGAGTAADEHQVEEYDHRIGAPLGVVLGNITGSGNDGNDIEGRMGHSIEKGQVTVQHALGTENQHNHRHEQKEPVHLAVLP